MRIRILVSLCAASLASSTPAWTWTLALNASINEQALALTAQGLLNRDAPSLWLYTPVFWTYPPSTTWFPERYLAPVKGFVFTDVPGDFCALAAATGLLAGPDALVRGLALYDDAALDASRWLSITASSLYSLLPVTRALLAEHACLAPLPILADYSDPSSRGWTSNVAAYEWAMRNLLPNCSSTSVYSGGHSFTDATEAVALGNDPAIDIGLDGAVALKMFVFNLSPDSTKYPAHAATFRSIVAALATQTVVTNVVGWAEPEPDMTLMASEGGGSVLCDGAPNFSFWMRVAASPPVLPYNVRGTVLETERVYLAWQTNEGDTPKIAAALQAGLWLDPARGSIPMSWGVNPLLLELAPGLLEFYAATATANDTFFSATAGAGYAYPSKMPPQAFSAYVQRAAASIRALTPGWPPYSWEVDIWDSNVAANISSYARIAGDAVGLFSMQPESMAGTNTVLPGGLPLVITALDLWYPFTKTGCPADGDVVAALARVIVNATASLPRPAFLLVYGIEYDVCTNTSMFAMAAGVQALLWEGNATFPGARVVGMQDYVRLAREAAALAS